MALFGRDPPTGKRLRSNLPRRMDLHSRRVIALSWFARANQCLVIDGRSATGFAIFPSHRLQANDCRSMEYINGFCNPRPLGILLCKTQPAMDVTQHWVGKVLSLLNGRWLKRALAAARKPDRSTSQRTWQRYSSRKQVKIGVLPYP